MDKFDIYGWLEEKLENMGYGTSDVIYCIKYETILGCLVDVLKEDALKIHDHDLKVYIDGVISTLSNSLVMQSLIKDSIRITREYRQKAGKE